MVQLIFLNQQISNQKQHQSNDLVTVRDQDADEPEEGDDQSVPEEQRQVCRQERQGRNPCCGRR